MISKENLKNLFSEAKETIENNPNDFDSNDLQVRAETLIQKAEENRSGARIDWNSSASFKFSFFIIIIDFVLCLHDWLILIGII